jgi:hypothetical protein
MQLVFVPIKYKKIGRKRGRTEIKKGKRKERTKQGREDRIKHK